MRTEKTMEDGNNKEKAEKEMGEAEECYKANDILGADKHITKAHSLNPSHPHITKVMAAIRVHVVALDKPSRPSMDYWCNILGCNPTDDFQIMKLQYKKMCLLIHPDKNPSICSDEAFKIVSDAWEVLSASRSQNQSKDNPRSDTSKDSNGASRQHKPSESFNNYSQSFAGDHNTYSSMGEDFFYDSSDDDEEFAFDYMFRFDTESIQVTKLVHIVLSWSLKDVFNKNLFKDEVKRIPRTFSSLKQYLNSFTNPLIEETRADLCSNLETISQSPYVEVEHMEELSPTQSHYYIKLKSKDDFLGGKETYNPIEADMLVLSECKITHISDLIKDERSYVIAYVLKAGNETDVLSSKEHLIKTSGRFPIEKYFQKRSGKEPIQVKPLYAIHVLTMITVNRIWKSLDQHMSDQGSDDIVNNVWNHHFLDAEERTSSSSVYVDDLENFKLNKSQFEAVQDCLSAIYDQNMKKTIKLIWGPPGTGKTKTISTLLYILIQKNSKTIACAPTNTAIKELATRLLKLAKESKVKHFCLGDVVLFGNRNKMKIDDDLSEVFIDDRVERLEKVFMPLKGWRHQISSMLDLFENATSQYQLYLKDMKEEEQIKSQKPTLKEFIAKHFFSRVKDMCSCLIVMSSDIPRVFISMKNLENMSMLVNLVLAFGKCLRSVKVTSDMVVEIFKEPILGISNEDLSKNQLLGNLQTIRSRIVKTLEVLSRTISLPDLCSRSSIQEFCLKNVVVIICTACTSFKLRNMQMVNPIENLVVDETTILKECESLIPLHLPGIRRAIL